MPRKVRDEGLSAPTTRLALQPRRKPYFRRLTMTLHLGYYRSAAGRAAGSWIARRYLGAGRYETTDLGAADDLPQRDQPIAGERFLSFDEAQRMARAWAAERAEAEHAAATDDGTGRTVRAAVEGYIAARKARAARAGRDAELRLSCHVLNAPLADLRIAALTAKDLAGWRAGLGRGGRGKRRKDPSPLAPATLARLLNDVRAALNAAKPPERVRGIITDGLKAPEAPDRARPAQVLSDADVRRIVEAGYAADPDFGALLLVLAATGCRFDQAARLTVADLQIANGRLMVPVSRKGRGTSKKTASHTAMPLPDDVMAQLRPLIAGRRGHEPLLMRWHHRQAEGDKAAGRLPAWVRDERRPWKVAAEMSRPWRAALVAAELPGDLVPYCLRHSSIVRGLRAGLPVRLVAAAHDTSVAMIEAHYSAFIVDAAEDLLRRAALPLAPATVAALRPVAKAG